MNPRLIENSAISWMNSNAAQARLLTGDLRHLERTAKILDRAAPEMICQRPSIIDRVNLEGVGRRGRDQLDRGRRHIFALAAARRPRRPIRELLPETVDFLLDADASPASAAAGRCARQSTSHLLAGSKRNHLTDVLEGRGFAAGYRSDPVARLDPGGIGRRCPAMTPVDHVRGPRHPRKRQKRRRRWQSPAGSWRPGRPGRSGIAATPACAGSDVARSSGGISTSGHRTGWPDSCRRRSGHSRPAAASRLSSACRACRSSRQSRGRSRSRMSRRQPRTSARPNNGRARERTRAARSRRRKAITMNHSGGWASIRRPSRSSGS